MSSENFQRYVSTNYILTIVVHRYLGLWLVRADAFPDFLNIIINENANFFKFRNLDLTHWFCTGTIGRRGNHIEFALVAFALALKQTDYEIHDGTLNSRKSLILHLLISHWRDRAK